MTATVVARKPAVGDAYWVLGGLYEVKVTSEESDGALVVMQMTMPEGMGPPPHTHPGAEAVYVLDGTIRYHIGEETMEGEPGSFFYVPAGTWENFEPLSTVRVLVEYMPGGNIDKFFAEVGEPARTRDLPPASEAPPDVDRLISAAARYGMEMRRPEGM
ncbi:cupin domain-containing protein [Thermomonospora amylolytica]|uniref:cupin domain-containing protein n=1 Tax=Thermomonospora amylolytica TaxID=1411117 RepID=UPI0013006D17|nr:cupin domain-containing protein [Thermomonospora amylolytica]